jgi:hypothetical protein
LYPTLSILSDADKINEEKDRVRQISNKISGKKMKVFLVFGKQLHYCNIQLVQYKYSLIGIEKGGKISD